jgi:hypothetical protein
MLAIRALNIVTFRLIRLATASLDKIETLATLVTFSDTHGFAPWQFSNAKVATFYPFGPTFDGVAWMQLS